MIVKKVRFLLLLGILQTSLFTQTIEIGDWLGEWESTFQINGENLKEYLLIKEIHKRNFIQFEINGGFIEDSTLEFKYTTDMFLTLDFENRKFAGFLIDDHGFNGMMQLNGEMTGQNELTIEGESPLMKDKTIWQLNDDGNLYRKSNIKLKETGKVSSTEAVFVKMK